MYIDHHYFEFIHVLAVFCWMVGMFYLPRLFVYHASVLVDSDTDKIFQTMERRLMNGIMMPAMIVSLLFGVVLAVMTGHYINVWLHIKFVLVFLMIGLHFLFNHYRKQFTNGVNIHSPIFYKVLNEVVTVIFSVIIFLAIVKPFR